MEETNFNRSDKSSKDNLFGAASLFLLVATVFIGTLFVKELKADKGDNLSTISIAGSGEVFAVPDVALISFTIREEAQTSKEATVKMAEKESKALNFLKSKDINEKDIKTLWLSTNPKYESVRTATICSPTWCPPDYGKQEIVGYESSETIQVKVRNTDMVGELIDGLTGVGIGEINGPDFSVDDPDTLRAEARRIAIEDAKEKAEVLRKDLGVKLVRIVSYSEGGDYPIYYGYGMGGGDMAKMESAPAPALEISTGEQKITSNVTIVYEIR